MAGGGELVTATIVVCDLVGSTQLAGRIGDDRADEVRRACFDAWRRALGRTSGEEVKTQGDGMIAAFSSVVDGLDCAVGMQRETARVARDHDGVALKVGLSTGEATREHGDYFGTPVVEAARLADACAARQILAVDVVERLAGSRGTHRFAPAGHLDLKGLGSVPAVEVQWDADDESVPFPALLVQARRTPFVGRAAHRQHLEEVYRDIEGGGRHVVLLAGEPGVGKTRLTAEFAAHVHDEGAIVVAGRCDEGLGAPFQPWVQILEQIARSVSDDRIDAALGLQRSRLGRLVAAFGVPEGSREGADERYRLLDAIDRLLSSLAERTPLLVVLDDLHWADESSLHVLRHVAGSTRDGGVLVVATYRDTDVDRRHPLAKVLADLRRHQTVERRPVRGLDTDEVAELIASRAGHEAPAEFVEAIAEQTEGNPFFADEILQHLARTGAIRREDGRWTALRDLDDLGIPEGVRDVIGQRLSLLSEAANDFLTVGAVIGHEFDLTVAADVAQTDKNHAMRVAEEATTSALLAEVEGAVGRYTFTHALVRQTLLEEVSTTRRVHLHWAIGDHLDSIRADPAAVASHYAEGVLAGDIKTAVTACLEAGRRAADRLAAAEAQIHHQRACLILDQAGWEDDALRVDALVGLGGALMAQFRRLDAEPVLLRAADIAKALGDDERSIAVAMALGRFGLVSGAMTEAGAALGERLFELVDHALALTEGQESRERVVLLARTAVARRFERGSPRESRALYQSAQAIARNSGDPQTWHDVGPVVASWLHNTEPDPTVRVGWIDEWRHNTFGDAGEDSEVLFAAAREALVGGDRAGADEGLRAWVESGPGFGSGVRGRDPSGVPMASLLVMEGRFDEAVERLRRFRRGERSESGELDPMVDAVTNDVAGQALTLRGQGAIVAERRRPLLDAGLIPQVEWAVLARDEATRGDNRAALNAASQVSDDVLDLTQFPRAAVPLAETAAWSGDRGLAERILPRVRRWSGQFLIDAALRAHGSADVATGQCLAVLGRPDDAMSMFESGIRLEEDVRARALATRSRYFFARCLRDAGELDRAREVRDKCIAAADELGMALIAGRARSLGV